MIAVLFDMDGVLVDNAKYHIRAFAEYLESYGVEFTLDLFGKSNEEILKAMFPQGLSKEKVEEMAIGKEKYFRQIYDGHVVPLAGLIKLLDSLQLKGIPIAIGSSAPLENIDFIIDRAGLRKYFKHIANSEMVNEAKPAPDIYLKAAEMLGVKPSQCVVFEDSKAGIESGKAAGMKVVGITTSLQPDEMPQPDMIIKDFTEITPEILENLVK